MHPNVYSLKCPECRQPVGKRHTRDCKSGVCALYGIWSKSICILLHSEFGTRHYPSFFNGYRAGELEAITRGWVIKQKNQTLQPDLNRVLKELDWVPEWQIYVKENTVPNLVSGRSLIKEVVARLERTDHSKKTKLLKKRRLKEQG